ncbi:GTP pyrophosphokinase [Spiroplasma helicoides]|uniref:Penta-phosphate guanosine-3'-pyrophosphohydrolase n=1 Tax=Spiroplasma helicoides TaxID=216938 RepID=A0A1B3SKZ2_9MOLU|nr:RelA/SpoT family protein [Spiroplasma helicoides]AOG60587.1 GTP pyrophosphokinase [Spiroplasma helicoides]
MIQDSGSFNYVECRDVETLITEIKKYIKNENVIENIRKAYYFAEEKHKDQKRKNGDPFIIHPLSTAYYLAQWKMGEKTIIAGLLHDVVEDTPVTSIEIEEMYGSDVSSIVESVTKVSYFTKENRAQMKARYLRRLFLSMIRDIRVIIVKIADRMHNILTLKYMKPEKQKLIAKETLDIYSTIAHRIGMKSAQNLLEDFSFEYLHPDDYKKIVYLLEEDKEVRLEIINNIMLEINTKIADYIPDKEVLVFGRSKTVYSIYRKMHIFGKAFQDINDIIAVRIIAKSVEDCYRILGIVHQMYTPLSGRFKDYIATPKNNLYQSLHTTLASKDGVIFEVQIRTQEMDDVAEHGAAAHWKYKENDGNLDVEKVQKEIDEKVDMFNRLTNLEKASGDWEENGYENLNEKYGENVEEAFRNDYLTALVYILTPDGHVVTLPFGSSVLDFAYKIHTDVGNKTIGAKINGVFSPYNATLNSGDMVEVQTAKDVEPQEKWLRFVRTSTARKAIESHLSKKALINKEKQENSNKALIQHTRKQIYRYIVSKNLKWKVNSIDEIQRKLKVLDYKNIDDFLLSVGNNDFTIEEAVNIVFVSKDDLKNSEQLNDMKIRKYRSIIGRDDIKVNGIEKFNCSLAQCCYPIPFESISSFLSKTKGIQIHRSECVNIVNIKKVKNILDTEWIPSKVRDKTYSVKIRISTQDRPGIMMDILSIFAFKRINVSESKMVVSEKDFTVHGTFIIEVLDAEELNTTLTTLQESPGVIKVWRSLSNGEENN